MLLMEKNVMGKITIANECIRIDKLKSLYNDHRKKLTINTVYHNIFKILECYDNINILIFDTYDDKIRWSDNVISQHSSCILMKNDDIVSIQLEDFDHETRKTMAEYYNKMKNINIDVVCEYYNSSFCIRKLNNIHNSGIELSSLIVKDNIDNIFKNIVESKFLDDKIFPIVDIKDQTGGTFFIFYKTYNYELWIIYLTIFTLILYFISFIIIY